MNMLGKMLGFGGVILAAAALLLFCTIYSPAPQQPAQQQRLAELERTVSLLTTNQLNLSEHLLQISKQHKTGRAVDRQHQAYIQELANRVAKLEKSAEKKRGWFRRK